ncbi:MAG: carboxypeptidase regulatory-like domain-containing protein [Thermodesulfovibrionales bacterium]|nr:carboxypeptidase regulatory-like domain-containing protein [Thermodesulfovibrionales bacterium]
MFREKTAILLCIFLLSMLFIITYSAIGNEQLPTQPLGGAPPTSLKLINVQSFEDPQIMNNFIANRAAAIQLGKALFWDMQVGSDGIQACASCHFHAGADNRTRNQLSPGLLAGDNTFGNSAIAGVPGFTHFGPNYNLRPSDFPLHQRQIPDDQQSAVIRDTNDVVSSQGVVLSQFIDIQPGNPVDLTSPLTDPVFRIGGVNIRRVEPRNSPSVINAILNFANFHDGRANNIFNGQNPFGPLDPDARVLRNTSSGMVLDTVRINNASLASQAVGPPLSDFEMSARGRTFPKLGKKMLTLTPLGKQFVHPNDSVLGVIARSRLVPGAKGLTVSYADLIRQAFQPQWWNNTNQIVRFQTPTGLFHLPTQQDPRTFPLNSGIPTILPHPGRPLTTDEYTQMEANFSLFFGLSIQLYLSTLISDDTPFDRFAAGDPNAMSDLQQRGLNVFTGKGKCSACHSGVAFSNASIPSILGLEPGGDIVGPIEFMNMSQGVAFYDQGFYNIAVRPTSEDISRGGTAPTINPLTGEPYPLSFTRLAMLKRDNLLPPEVAQFTPDLPINFPEPFNRAAVNGAVKTLMLRNIELTGPYFRNGSGGTLLDVIEFYSRGGNFPALNIDDLDADIEEIGFNLDDEAQLLAFFEALTDERVRNEMAPFDRPQLFIPAGHANRPGWPDIMIELKAVGAGGRPAEGLPPLRPFLESFFIHGRTLTTGGTPIGGVTVILTGGPGPYTITTISDSTGQYSFTGLTPGDYTITPSLAGRTFTPLSRNVTINNDDLLDQDFTAPGFSISGTITRAGTPLPGVTVNLTGAATTTTTTDVNGNYTFSNLNNGNYTVTRASATGR